MSPGFPGAQAAPAPPNIPWAASLGLPPGTAICARLALATHPGLLPTPRVLPGQLLAAPAAPPRWFPRSRGQLGPSSALPHWHQPTAMAQQPPSLPVTQSMLPVGVTAWKSSLGSRLRLLSPLVFIFGGLAWLYPLIWQVLAGVGCSQDSQPCLRDKLPWKGGKSSSSSCLALPCLATGQREAGGRPGNNFSHRNTRQGRAGSPRQGQGQRWAVLM